MIIYDYKNNMWDSKSPAQKITILIKNIVAETKEKAGFVWYDLYLKFLGKEKYSELKKNKSSIISQIESSVIEEMIEHLIEKYEVVGSENKKDNKFRLEIGNIPKEINVRKIIKIKFESKQELNLFDYSVGKLNVKDEIKKTKEDEKKKLEENKTEFARIQEKYDAYIARLIEEAGDDTSDNGLLESSDFHSLDIEKDSESEINKIISIKQFFLDNKSEGNSAKDKLKTFLFNILVQKMTIEFNFETFGEVYGRLNGDILKYLDDFDTMIYKESKECNYLNFILNDDLIGSDFEISIPINSKKSRRKNIFSLFTFQDWEKFCKSQPGTLKELGFGDTKNWFNLNKNIIINK
ncbi:MAG: hypothetical protein P9M11_04185 [Candidatus Tenebribacter burtonii]|nr:hypothetical protein [Candidatus Tenebribacter burtonii]